MEEVLLAPGSDSDGDGLMEWPEAWRSRPRDPPWATRKQTDGWAPWGPPWKYSGLAPVTDNRLQTSPIRWSVAAAKRYRLGRWTPE